MIASMLSKSPSTIVVFHPDDIFQQTYAGATGYLSMVFGIESRGKHHPYVQDQRFDQWVERACFLYHASKASSTSETHVCLSSQPLLALANVPWTPGAVLPFALESLSCDPAFARDRLQPLNTLRVINTLLRLVHGGSGGQDGALIRACGAVIDPFNVQKSRSKTQKTNKKYQDELRFDPFNVQKSRSKTPKTNKKYQDEWRLDGHTQTRVHNVPRSSRFVPSECDDCPINISRLADDRFTEHFYKTGKESIHDSWRFRGNSTPSSRMSNGLEAQRFTSSLTDDTEAVFDKIATGSDNKEGIAA